MSASPRLRRAAQASSAAAALVLAAPLGAQVIVPGVAPAARPAAPAAASAPPAAPTPATPGAGAATYAVQPTAPVGSRRAGGERWAVGAQYLHANAAPIGRSAEPSMTFIVSRALGGRGEGADGRRGLRAEGGWLRASRVRTQAQGVTLGLSYGVPVGGPLTRRHAHTAPHADGAAPSARDRGGDGRPALAVRPGVAVLAGWAEAQAGGTLYHWRGLPGTPYAGQTGTAPTWHVVRGRTTGVGAMVAAELRLSRAVALTGTVQRWAFTGAVIRPDRQSTLAGFGLAVRPRTLAGDSRNWWRQAAGQMSPARQNGTASSSAAAADSTAAVRRAEAAR